MHSDGAFTPEIIVQKAFNAGLTAISITDHDSIAGIEETRKIAANYNIEVINGIELSAEFNGKELHILAYFFDLHNEALNMLLDFSKIERRKRAERILKKLNYNDYELSLKDVLKISKNSTIGRPHIAQVMIDKGYAINHQQAFNKYLGNHAFGYEKKVFLAPEKAFELIKSAGGISIIAHPGTLSDDNIKELIKLGVSGFEVSHPSHSKAQKAYYQKVVDQNYLIGTVGSDYHGNRHFDEANFGKFFITGIQLDNIRKRINAA